jgi:hypothetical protein
MSQETQARPVRNNVRVDCNAAAVITTETDTCPGVCESLSIAGAFVRCEAAPAQKDVSMILCLPSLGPVEVAGEILYREARGCGIRFTHVASAAVVAICTFVGTVC